MIACLRPDPSARTNRVRRAHFRATPLCISDRHLTTFKVKQRPPKQDEFPEWCELPLQGVRGVLEKLGAANIFTQGRGRMYLYSCMWCSLFKNTRFSTQHVGRAPSLPHRVVRSNAGAEPVCSGSIEYSYCVTETRKQRKLLACSYLELTSMGKQKQQNDSMTQKNYKAVVGT